MLEGEREILIITARVAFSLLLAKPKFSLATLQLLHMQAYNMANLCELNRFQIYREVKLHSSLQHENIIQLFAAFQEGDQVRLARDGVMAWWLYAVSSDL